MDDTTTLVNNDDDDNEVLSLPACNLTTRELGDADGTTEISPCMLYDTHPQPATLNGMNNRTTVITVVGVFPSMCDIHRDGAYVAAKKINGDNMGRGHVIGYLGEYFLQIRLVVGIAGNSRQLTPDAYETAHQSMLEDLLQMYKPQYILGSCSFYAELDKPLAKTYQTMVLSQVGPDSFYQDETASDYVFGVHIQSETYGIPALQALKFATATPYERQTQKIRIVHRDRSVFFQSTCLAVYDQALLDGFTDTVAMEYNPDGDEDGNGILNHEDVTYLQSLADQACSKEEAGDQIALWACIQSDLETNTLLDRWKENGCRPASIWLTVASWDYANKFPEAIPYTQSGAQWHKAMKYSDEYFGSGQEMLDYAAQLFGYELSYGATGAYHAIYLVLQNTVSFVKTKDAPHVQYVYETQYEEIRRHLLGMTVPNSLYGPTSFNEYRRNIGRGSAGLQWVPPLSESDNNNTNDKDNPQLEMILVSPIEQAQALVVVPAPAATYCPAGHFVNQSRVETDASLLLEKCSPCPVNTFQPFKTTLANCRPCNDDSSTQGETGAELCIREEENLISNNLLIFGYVIMAMVFVFAVIFGCWTIYHRNDPVVQIGQIEFLLLICCGSIVSSSSILPLSMQAGEMDDGTSASRACMAIPWLYTTGWILQYSSLFAKSYRMNGMMEHARAMRRATITSQDTANFVLLALAINWMVVLAWTLVDPLTWEREDQGTTLDQASFILTNESMGTCTSDYMSAWIGSLLGFHFTIMVATNVLLWKLRAMSDRYQESKYVTLASAFACEILLLGVPILLAVDDSSAARHIALCFIVAFSDLGILWMIFIPKMQFQRKGLPEGTSVVSSILRASTQNHNSIRTFAMNLDQVQEDPPPGGGNDLSIERSPFTNSSEQENSKVTDLE